MMLKGERDARCSSFCCNTIPYNIFFACKYITFISLSNDTYQHQRTFGVLSTNLGTLGTFKTRDQSSNIFRIVHYTDKSVNFVNTAIFFLHSLKIWLWRLWGWLSTNLGTLRTFKTRVIFYYEYLHWDVYRVCCWGFGL